ncbi:rubrerythrin-like domain-containing protein [Haloterrigena sp. H1]|nr:rubrerythrin-like domain-containing protein [Haloterrigena sp. H1]TMT86039.1 rubrerythrin-like domain-containing protein [Haloterrigena sp. H1]
MTRKGEREYVCVQCGRQETVGDALLSTCQQCGGEMRNVDLIRG